jgi:protein-tyrosine-phosphatase
MAAGFLRHIAGDRVNVTSGGSNPGNAVNPIAVQAMTEVGIDIESFVPQPFTRDDVTVADVVITMGCGDTCPIFPGKRYEDWVLEDPAGKPIDVVREIRDEIERRVETLYRSLVTS